MKGGFEAMAQLRSHQGGRHGTLLSGKGGGSSEPWSDSELFWCSRDECSLSHIVCFDASSHCQGGSRR